MVGTGLVSLMILLAIPPDAAALVARLGSGTAADREEAAGQLEALGRPALPALEAVLRSPDAEVRARALSVWERIQRGLLVRPTMVRLDGRRRPLTEVLRSIGEQGGLSLEFSSQREEPIIDAREPAPIPFWEAIERLGLGGGYFHQVQPRGRDFPSLEFGRTVVEYPSTISGPFRIELEGIHDHRDRLLTTGPWLRLDLINQRLPIPRATPPREDRLYLGLGMKVEPRMWFSQEGPARAIEAVDDLGQSLVRREAARIKADQSVLHNRGGVTEGHLELDLAMPERPGRTIARLRGSIPVSLEIRRPVPALEIPVPAPVGKTFHHEDAVFTIREFREDAQGTLINLDLRANLDRLELPAGRDSALALSRLNSLMRHQLEVVDAEGRFLAEAGAGGSSSDGRARWTFRAGRRETGARPAAIRYYRMLRVFTDVAFEFHNVLMP